MANDKQLTVAIEFVPKGAAIEEVSASGASAVGKVAAGAALAGGAIKHILPLLVDMRRLLLANARGISRLVRSTRRGVRVLEQYGGALSKVSEIARSVTRRIGGRLLVRALAIGVLIKGGAAALGFAANVAKAGNELVVTAEKIGINTRALAQWETIVQDAGGSVDEARIGLETFTEQVAEAALESGDARSAFKKLGISTAELKNTDPATLLEQTTAQLASVENRTKRAALATELYGDSANRFIAIGEQGIDSIRKQRDEFDALFGLRSFDEFTSRSAEAATQLARFRRVIDILKQRVASALLPVLSLLTRAVSSVLETFARLSADTRIVEVGLIAIGVAGVIAFGLLTKAMLPFLIAISPIIAIVAVVAGFIILLEDLFGLFSGNRSAVGALLDELFGIGTAKAVAETVEKALFAVFDAVVALGRGFAVLGSVIFEVLVSIPDYVVAAAEAVYDLFDMLSDAGADAIEAVVKAFVGAGRAIRRVVSSLGRFVVSVYTGLFDTVVNALKRIRNALGAVVEGVKAPFVALRRLIEGALTAIQNKLIEVRDFVTGIINKLTDLIDSAKALLPGGPDAKQGLPADFAFRNEDRVIGSGRRSAREAPINNNTVFNVQATDPAGVAREVEARQEETLGRLFRRVRDVDAAF